MTANVQIQRTIVRMLQQGGYAVAKGDAQRVFTALDGQPVKTGRVLAIAQSLALPKVVQRRPRKVLLDEAWRTMARALPERIDLASLDRLRGDVGHQIAQILRAESPPGMDLSTGPLAGCERVRALIATEATLIPAYSAICFERNGRIVTLACGEMMIHVKTCLRTTFRDCAEDLVHDLSDEHIDALATIPSFADAHLALDPYLLNDGIESGAYLRTLRRAFDMPTGEFFARHVPNGAALYEQLATPLSKVA